MELDKRTRLMIAGGAGVLVLLVGVYMLWPSGDSEAPTPEVVQAAVEASKQATQQEPAQAEEPKREGRARPGMLGGGQ